MKGRTMKPTANPLDAAPPGATPGDATRRRLLGTAPAAVLMGVAGAWGSALTAHAQGAWPARPIRIVVPFPPGGSTDLLARRIGERLATALGQAVVVDNRPGAGGATGADHVAKSAPDGYTLLMGVTGSNAISASLNPSLPYNPVKDFTPVSQVVSAPLVLTVNASSPIKTVRDYIAAARAKPMNFASPGNGTSMHLTGEMFGLATDLKLTHVAYKGSAQATNDLLAGTVESTFGDVLVLLPHIKAGKLTALAVSSPRRHPLLPEVPTIAESGGALAGFEAASWQGLFAPAGLPRDILTRLNTEVVKAIEAPEIRDFFGQQGFIVGGSTPDQFRAFIETEVPKWARVVKAANVTVN